MSDEPHNNRRHRPGLPGDGDRSDEEQLVDQMILASLERLEDRALALDDEVLMAYMHGAASEQEQEIVRKALVRSPDLRRELIDLSADLETLREQDVRSRFAATTVPPLPVPITKRVQEGRKSSSLREFWRRLREGWTLRPIVIAGVATVAAVAIFISVVDRPWQNSGPEGMRLMPGPMTLTNELFEPFVTRGTLAGPTAADAALSSFQGSIEFVDGRSRSVATNRVDLEREGRRVELTDRRGRAIGSVLVPTLDEAQEVEIWFLALPDLYFGHAPWEETTKRVIWPRRTTKGVYATLTWRRGERYYATSAVPARFERTEVRR